LKLKWRLLVNASLHLGLQTKEKKHLLLG